MNTAVINIKTDPEVKVKAQKLAEQMGFSLSALINGYLRHFTRTKTVHFTMKDEVPSEYLIKAIKEAEADRKAGRYRSFSKAKDAIEWLNSIVDN